MTTFEAWKNRQVLLQLPTDEREHLELPPPEPDGPLGTSNCPWRCWEQGLLLSLRNSFFFFLWKFLPLSFQFQNRVWIWHVEKVARRRGIRSSKLKNEANLSNVYSSIIFWQLYPKNKGFQVSVSREDYFNIVCNFEIRNFSDASCHDMMEEYRKNLLRSQNLLTLSHTFSLHSFHWVICHF